MTGTLAGPSHEVSRDTMTTMTALPSRSGHVPLPIGTIKHRPPHQGKPSPFANVRPRVAPEGSFKFEHDKDRIAAQREGRAILRRLDARRKQAEHEAFRQSANERRSEIRRKRREAKAAEKHVAPPPPQPNSSTKSLVSDERLLELLPGRTARQLSELTGLNQRTIRRRVEALGQKVAPAPSRRVTDSIPASEIVRLRGLGMGWRNMAVQLGISYTTLRQYRHELGIEPVQRG